MKDSSDIDTLHSEVVFLKMREKTTEELTSIWTENNQKVWNKDELDAVQRILMERLGRLPEQKEAVDGKAKNRPRFEFSLIDRITLEMFWFLVVLCAVWVIISKLLGGK